VIAGIIASSLPGTHSWRLLFVVAGLLPMLMACALLVALPESPRFLAKTKANAARLSAVLKSIGRPVNPSLSLTLDEETCAVETMAWARSPIRGAKAEILWHSGAHFSFASLPYI
jgi:MFS family permease